MRSVYNVQFELQSYLYYCMYIQFVFFYLGTQEVQKPHLVIIVGSVVALFIVILVILGLVIWGVRRNRLV